MAEFDAQQAHAAMGHTLVDAVVAYHTRRDLVKCAAKPDLVAATNAEQRKETPYRDCVFNTHFAE